MKKKFRRVKADSLFFFVLFPFFFFALKRAKSEKWSLRRWMSIRHNDVRVTSQVIEEAAAENVALELEQNILQTQCYAYGMAGGFYLVTDRGAGEWIF